VLVAGVERDGERERERTREMDTTESLITYREARGRSGRVGLDRNSAGFSDQKETPPKERDKLAVVHSSRSGGLSAIIAALADVAAEFEEVRLRAPGHGDPCEGDARKKGDRETAIRETPEMAGSHTQPYRGGGRV
jgi:hypothetical protein